MICFGIKTDQEVKENVTYGSHTNKLKKNKNKTNEIVGIAQRERERNREIFFLIFFLLSLLSSIYGNRTVRIRRGKKQSALLDEGYA